MTGDKILTANYPALHVGLHAAAASLARSRGLDNGDNALRGACLEDDKFCNPGPGPTGPCVCL